MMNLGDVLLVLTLGMSSTLASPASGGAELDPLPPPAEVNSNRNQDVSSAASASQCSQPSPAIMKCKEIGCKGSTRTHAFSLHISLKQCRSMFLVIQQAICNDVHINNMYGDKHMLNYLFIKLGRSDACRSEAEGCVVGSVPGHRCTIAAQPAVGALCDPTVNGGTAVAFSPSGSGASVCSNGHVVCTCLYGFYIDHKYAWHCKWTTKDGSVLPNQVCPELTASADDAARANDEAIYDYAWSGVITYSGSGRSHFNSFPLDENTNSNKRGRTIGIIIGSIVGINAAMVVILNVSKSYGTLPQQNVDANNANNNHGDDHLDALEAGVDDVVPGGGQCCGISRLRVQQRQPNLASVQHSQSLRSRSSRRAVDRCALLSRLCPLTLKDRLVYRWHQLILKPLLCTALRVDRDLEVRALGAARQCCSRTIGTSSAPDNTSTPTRIIAAL